MPASRFPRYWNSLPRGFGAELAVAAALASAIAAPQARAQESNGTIVVTAPGDLLGDDDATEIDAQDLRRASGTGLPGAIGSRVAGASLSEAQSNPYQPNLTYHGFTASPLQGNGQGLAVYVDGIRFNQAFGDTVDFDLLPQEAIESLSIRDASPVYGLNALGGALVVETRTGRTSPGVTMEASAGDHGRREGSVVAGWKSGALSAFFAGEASHDGGWRQHSPSTLYNLFGDLGWDAADAGVHLKVAAADTNLTGNGPAPVELLAAKRDAVFTYPDNTRNRYLRVSLHPWIALGEHSRLEASLGFQALRQKTVNGDLADIEGCENDPSLLCLTSGEDEQSLLRGTNGALVPAVLAGGDYGVLNRSRTRSDMLSALVQLTDDRRILGRRNKLAAGFSFDRGRTRFASSTELGELTETRGVDGLGTIIDQPDATIAPVSLHVASDYWGLFLSDRLALGSGFSLEVGARWNHAAIRLDDRLGAALDGRHSYQRFDPGVELGYRAGDRLSLRLGYSEANRAPTPAELSCADENAPCSLTNFFLADPPLKQVVSRSWRAGASGRFGGAWKGEWSLLAYRSDNSDDLEFISSQTRGRAFFRNIGKTRRQGIEASLDLAGGRCSIRLSYAFTVATFRTAFLINSPQNPAADAAGRIQVRPGDRIPSIPRHRGVISVGYDRGPLELGAELQLQSSQYFAGDQGDDEKPVSGFAVVNLRGGYRLADHLTLFGSVTNLFDRRYATFGTFSETSEVDFTEAPGASNPRSLSPGEPRRWKIGVRVEM
jgi:outer membrane receptor protein involved in Fe transport